jgi:hypothetical protein
MKKERKEKKREKERKKQNSQVFPMFFIGTENSIFQIFRIQIFVKFLTIAK